MSVTVSWNLHDRIIHVKLEGNLLKDELDPSNQIIAQYVREGQPPVHVIVDAVQLDKFPMDLKQFSGSKVYLREPNMGKLVIISKQSVFVRFFASVISQAAHIEMQMFDDMDSGLAYLQRVDGSVRV
ncbi:MAG: hypothetical protein ABI690_07995 [Chloroflexota bacterium]